MSDARYTAEVIHDDETCARDTGDLTEYETGCLNGHLYGHCGDEYCGGLCEYVGDCPCVCHRENKEVKPNES
jgi:hypothetical protein